MIVTDSMNTYRNVNVSFPFLTDLGCPVVGVGRGRQFWATPRPWRPSATGTMHGPCTLWYATRPSENHRLVLDRLRDSLPEKFSPTHHNICQKKSIFRQESVLFCLHYWGLCGKRTDMKKWHLMMKIGRVKQHVDFLIVLKPNSKEIQMPRSDSRIWTNYFRL